MRTTATCPKCSGKKIVVAPLHSLQGGGESFYCTPIPVLARMIGRVLRKAKYIGTFESWICAACGYTEFYAKDLHDLERFAPDQPNEIRIVDATSRARGPFR